MVKVKFFSNDLYMIALSMILMVMTNLSYCSWSSDDVTCFNLPVLTSMSNHVLGLASTLWWRVFEQNKLNLEMF